MNNRVYNENRMVMVILCTALALALVIAGLFAAMYVKERDTALPAGADVSEYEALSAENARLKSENEDLRSTLDALQTEPVTEQETEPPREPEPAVPDIIGDFDPGDLTPADPESLSYTFDLTKQLALIRELEKPLADMPFIVDPEGTLMLRSEVEFDDETEIIYREAAGTAYDADGLPLVREIDYEAMGYSFPAAAVSYRDLERGTTYSCNGDTVFFSASLIKAPYIYTLLDQIAQYNAIRRANPQNDPKVGKTLSESILEKYDLERKITITESMKADGSGTIREMDLSGGGKEFTVRELIGYAIKVSDNTAFRVLRDEFGYDYFWTVSQKLGVKSVFTSFNNLTADDAVTYLAAIYDFAAAYPEEGGLLINLMMQANHAVLIPAALSGQRVAHKYGWDHDSYHDMALVYGKAPYAVCIMTNFDFDKATKTINDYIIGLAQGVDSLHRSFYEETD